jgi:hypothetical protein
MAMDTGIAYFVRNRRPDVARADMEEIKAAGCSYVVHFFTEFDQVFFKQSVAEIVQVTKEAGLQVYIDPWSLGGFICTKYTLFPLDHPEACQVWSDGRPLMQACPNHPAFRDYMRRWLDDVVEIGGEVVFWDEPHLAVQKDEVGRVARWACRCEKCQALFAQHYGKEMPVELTREVMAFRQETLVRFFDWVTQEAKARGLKNCICLLSQEHGEDGFGDWSRIAALPAIDIFGTDPYWYNREIDLEAHVRHFSNKAVSLAHAYGKTPQIWLQGFRVPRGLEGQIEQAAAIACEAGVTNLAVWVDKYGTGDNNRSDDPEAVWEITKRLFQRLRA